ncbi:MAG: imidazoleglycerol-phosphate dehydratase HisB [Sedimentisphaerales bacterium]|jgi:imidazoleglycerol-phosphate dehydratase|nr:imidazoleglycerol-phosphate dehydratase HisB [Sedimentisphaerales bacterium]
MPGRQAQIDRSTTETQVHCQVDLDGTGASQIETGIGFLDHMLCHLARHSSIDIQIKARGDLHVDAHHTVEDVGICLGQALDKALGNKAGIARFGTGSVPMEDALAHVAVDLSGRPYCVHNVRYPSTHIGQLDVECLEQFLRAMSNSGRFNLHVNVPYGSNSHHIAEAIFKALGQALGQAVRITGHQVPSTKGIL